MAAKSWDKDFRYKAIQESMKVVRSSETEDLFECPSSFCIPVANKPIVGWTPGKIFIIFLVLGFVFLIAAAIAVGIAEKDTNRPPAQNALLFVVGSGMGIAGMGCFFTPVLFDKLLMKLLIGSRGRDLAGRDGELLCAEISHTDRSKMKIEIDGDDYVLLLADDVNRRLILEGVAARYLVRAEDVTKLAPFQFQNYVGAEVTFRVNETTSLSLAIARVSLLLELTRQLPFLYFMKGWIRNPILRACEEAVGREEE